MKKVITVVMAIFLFSIVSNQAGLAAKKSEKEYMANLSSDKDEKDIVEAADWARKETKKDTVPQLVKLLQDSRENVRLHSVMALGYIKEKSAVDAVNNILLNDESPTVRYAAVLASFRIGSPKSLDSWKAAMEKETDPFIVDFLKKMEEKVKGK